jgi:uncharacterized protein YecT (DUF1311 family)
MTTGIRALFTLALLVAPLSPAAAQSANCAAAQTQADMNACAAQQYQKSDAALNQVYAQLKAKLTDPQQQNLLVAAERAWVAYRDAECGFETSGSTGGSIRPMVLSMCLNEKTLVHSAELSRQLNCKEGDTSCAH